jgi:hypothetical protein
MKKLVFGLIALVMFGFVGNAKSQIQITEKDTITEVLKVKIIKGSITLSGGCHVDYTITVDYDIIPPRVNSIHGTVTLSGNCSGTQTFKMAANTNKKGEVLSLESDIDLKEIESEREEFNKAFIEDLNSLNLFQEK